ncbi:hypothetical protein HRbin30_01361 [bacterium HR30]|nr:hypothetical protein HRbin30_01361 [bacterium HR30]
MRQAILFVVYVLGALLAQTTLVPLVTRGAFTVDLLMVYVVYLGMRRHTVGAVVAAFLVGYLQDVISGTLYGLNAFATTLVYVAVYRTSRHLWVDNAVSQIFVVGMADTLKHCVVGLVLAFTWGPDQLGSLLGVASWSVLATALCSPIVFAILQRAEEFMTVGGD